MTYELQSDGRYHIPIIELGQRLRDNFGLRIREHSAFGDGSVGKHAPNSYHYYDEAIDVTDHRADDIDGVDWKTRTGNLQNILSGSGAEIIGPNSGDPNHSTHLHLAAKDGMFKLDERQYGYLFGGNAGGKGSTFAGFSSFTPPETPQPPTDSQGEAKERALNYKEMSKAEMNTAYDNLRSTDPAKARAEGMKMHKAYFKKP